MLSSFATLSSVLENVMLPAVTPVVAVIPVASRAASETVTSLPAPALVPVPPTAVRSPLSVMVLLSPVLSVIDPASPPLVVPVPVAFPPDDVMLTTEIVPAVVSMST